MKYQKFGLFALLAMVFFMVTPVFAQGENPPPTDPIEWQLLITKILTISVVGFFSAGIGSTGVELVKDLTRKVFGGNPKSKGLVIDGLGTVGLILLTSISMVTNLDLTFLNTFAWTKDIDPQLLNAMNIAVLAIAQKVVHDGGLTDYTYKARAA